MFYLNDSSRVWHVAKVGNDGNSGHAGQYPINLANDAKLTIGAAVTAAASGDKIIIWPGDYAENVNLGTKALTLIGVSRNQSKIVPATGNGVELTNNCILKNLSVEAIDTGTNSKGVSGSGKTNLIIEDCDIYGDWDAATLTNSNDVTLRNCRFRGKYDAANVAAVQGLIIENCVFRGLGTHDTNTHCRGLMAAGARGTISNSIFYAERADVSTKDFGGIDMIQGSQRAVLAIQNCEFYAKGGTNNTGNAFGIRVDFSNSVVSILNCAFYIESSYAATKYDITVANANALAVVSNCAWKNGLNGNVKVLNTLSPVDASGRVNLGTIKDVDADILIKAIKLLKNKAVQDKLTGAIRYYDDDGQTVILTHTPSEDGTSVTRTVS